MLKLTVYNYWRDANNYQQENSLFRSVFSYSEQIYCENNNLILLLQTI